MARAPILSKVIAGKEGINKVKSSGELVLDEGESPYSPDYGRIMQRAETAAKPFYTTGEDIKKIKQETQVPVEQGQLSKEYSIDDLKKELIEGQKIHDNLQKTNPIIPGSKNDADNEPYGFDSSDKATMLGSLFTGGLMGVEELGARAGQIGLLAGEKLHLAKVGASDDFTDQFNRYESRKKLFKDALHSHPIITEIGKIAGGTVATVPLMVAAEPIAGALSVGSLVPAAANMLINANRAGKALKLAEIAIKGSIAGETQYDPENNHYISQAVGGALAALGIKGASNTIKALNTKVGQKIAELSQQYGISLPLYPTVEKMAQYIPLSGYATLMKERGGQLSRQLQGLAGKYLAPAKQFVEGDNYADYFTGELKDTFNNTKKEIGRIFDSISDKVQGKGVVASASSKEMALQILQNEGKMPDSVKDGFLLNIAKDLSPETGKKWMDYSTFSDTMKRIGAKVSLEKDPDVKNKLGQLYHSMLDDQQMHLERKAPELLDDFHKAKSLYINKQLPFINGKFQPYRDDNANSDKFIGKFLKPNSPMTLNEMLTLLPDEEKGKVAAKAAIINQAMHDSNVEGAGINPVKFINSVLKYGKTNNVVFDKSEISAFKGYQKLIKYVGKISPDALDPDVVSGLKMTGKALNALKWKIGGSAAVGGAAHLAGIPSMTMLPIVMAPWAFTKMMTTKTGRDLMTAIHSISGNISNQKLDEFTSKFLDIALKKPAFIISTGEAAKFGRGM